MNNQQAVTRLKTILQFFFRGLAGIIGAFLLWIGFQIFPYVQPFSLGIGLYHSVYSALIHLAFIYLMYVLLVYVIGGKSLVKKIAYTRVISNIDIVQIIFRILAGILGVGAIRLFYGVFFIPGESLPDSFPGSGQSKAGGGLIVFPIVFLIYAIGGHKLLDRLGNFFSRKKPDTSNKNEVIGIDRKSKSN